VLQGESSPDNILGVYKRVARFTDDIKDVLQPGSASSHSLHSLFADTVPRSSESAASGLRVFVDDFIQHTFLVRLRSRLGRRVAQIVDGATMQQWWLCEGTITDRACADPQAFKPQEVRGGSAIAGDQLVMQVRYTSQVDVMSRFDLWCRAWRRWWICRRPCCR
jgi:hypothetical protein